MEKKSELTFKSIFIGIVLAILLCGANIYLGLKIGITISASIPAAIISLGILRLFKKYSILENSIAQTVASIGEALAVPIIFVFPALLIIGAWHQFVYWQIVFLGICGGFIGIAYSVLLRKILLSDKTLPFPEGNAIGNVLIATNNTKDKTSVKTIFKSILVAGTIIFCQSGLKVLGDNYYKFVKVGKTIFGMGISFSPAVLGAGYLIGGSATVVGLIGLLVGWLVLLPYFSLHYGIKNSSDIVASGFYTWKTYVRPVGIGVFLFSGVSTILMLGPQIAKALKDALFALNHTHEDSDKDLNINKQLMIAFASIIPVGIFIFFQIRDVAIGSLLSIIVYTVLACIVIMVLGFIISAVSGYMVGLVGSSNSPMSGLLFIAVIIFSVLVKLVLVKPDCFVKISEIVILIVGFIASSAAVINDNIQDYKSGQLVGATPYKQQISLYIGCVAALLIAPIMANFVFNAYGISGVSAPHANMDPHNMLNAPQASAIAMVVKSIISGHSDYSGMVLGVFLGVIIFIIDIIGKKTKKFRAPVVMLGSGLYLPPELILALFVGGMLSVIVKRKQRKLELTLGKEKALEMHEKSNIMVCGLIAGESLMGLILAVPFVLKKSSDALRVVSPSFYQTSQILSAIVTILLLISIYKVATKYKK